MKFFPHGSRFCPLSFAFVPIAWISALLAIELQSPPCSTALSPYRNAEDDGFMVDFPPSTVICVMSTVMILFISPDEGDSI